MKNLGVKRILALIVGGLLILGQLNHPNQPRLPVDAESFGYDLGTAISWFFMTWLLMFGLGFRLCPRFGRNEFGRRYIKIWERKPSGQ